MDPTTRSPKRPAKDAASTDRGRVVTAPVDAYGVTIEVGDVVRVRTIAPPLRRGDADATAVVAGFTSRGNVMLEGTGHHVDRIAAGRAVSPAHLGVLDREDRDNRVAASYEGNRQYRIVPSPTFKPSTLLLARRYRRIEDAVADMGEGVVVTADGSRVVAFHERHLPWMGRTAV